MATIDMTQRKLNFPPRFLPYLEKHRIFELFHECVELLVQVKPRDHIQFLKSVLPCADRKKDKQRIVFLAPPDFDRQLFAELIADCLGIQVISRSHLETLTKQRRLDEIMMKLEAERCVEEESCVCLEEEEPRPVYRPEEASYVFEEIVPPEEEVGGEEEIEFIPPSIPESEEVSLKEEDQPCICVCPCVKEEEEKKKKQEERQTKEDEIKAEEEEEIQPKQDQVKKEEEEEERKTTEEEKTEETSEERYDDDDIWEPAEETLLPCIPEKKKKKKKKPVEETLSESTVSSTTIDFRILTECHITAKGWILSDYPTTGEEAEELCALGVIPTHALRLFYDHDDHLKDRNLKWTVLNWTKAYKFVPVTEIKIGDRDLGSLSADMCQLLSRMPHRHAPMLPRIVLIGSRGSGTTTQGIKLAKKYKLVHVEFETVVAQVIQQDDEISKLYKEQMETRVEPELDAIILERVLLTPACRNRGWVLTGYPRNIDQMRMLDIIATPPNRIIFIEVPARECFVRLYYRKFDPCLGDEYKLPKILPSGFDSYETSDLDPKVAARLLTHPKNEKNQIIHDIETYFLEKKDMMVYCGRSAFYVDGNTNADAIFEQIEEIIIGSNASAPPRDPLSVNHGIQESYKRLKKFRLVSGMYLNNLVLNPPGRAV